MIVKTIYKTLRSIIFTLTLLVVGLYVLAYTLFSIPAFTNYVKDILAAEVSKLIGGEVLIADIEIYPFNEVNISGLEVFDPSGRKCLEVEKIGAGISLWRLMADRHIDLTFGEIIGLKGYLVQEEEGGPLNIDFIIRALSPKDDNKEKKDFDLALRNVVLRKSSISFKRPWMKGRKIGTLDQGDLQVENLSADISFPRLGNKGVEVDLRRLSLKIADAISIEKIGLKGEFNDKGVSAQDITIEFPNSRIYIPQISLSPGPDGDYAKVLREERQELIITQSYITPADFSFLYKGLESFKESLPLEIEASGNLRGLDLTRFKFGTPELIDLNFIGAIDGLDNIKEAKGEISDFSLRLGQTLIERIPFLLPPGTNLPHNLSGAIAKMGYLDLSGDIAADLRHKTGEGNFDLTSLLFDIGIEGSIANPSANRYSGQAEVTIENLHLEDFIPDSGLGVVNANVVAEGLLADGKPEGMVSLVVDNFEFKKKIYEGFSLNLNKTAEDFDGDLLIDNAIADIEARFDGDIEGEEKRLRLDLDLGRLDPSLLADLKAYNGYQIAGSLNLDFAATGTRELLGELNLNNFTFSAPDNSRRLRLHQLKLTASREDSLQRIDLDSDWIAARLEGTFDARELPPQLKGMTSSIFPALVPSQEGQHPLVAHNKEPHHGHIARAGNLDFDIHIKKNNTLPDFFHLPVRLLVPVNISGSILGSENSAWLELDLPYLQQGKDKLIYDTKLTANIFGDPGILDIFLQTALPVKKGDLALNVNLRGEADNLNADIHWINTENSDFKGHLLLDADFSRPPLSKKPEIALTLQPSILQMGTADWHLAQSRILYSGETIDIQGLRISHDDQFVELEGRASPEYADAVTIRLADIDVDYVFEMLAINYVTFGGTATGEISGRALLSGNPVAETESLVINDFTYNGAALGTCIARSKWNNEQKEIEIGADITMGGRQIVDAAGGIWLGRDSLSFDLSAHKVPVDFVQPFMAVFSSHVGGFATGDVKLFGTFHDIDMTGKIFADSVAVKLDYTNTIYHGSDSVFLNPGRIEIPHFRLYDKFGNSALLTGQLSHRYFHDPSFTFRLSDANNFLCYDTNSELNPDWYGTLFGTGSAYLTGIPGLVNISADMTVAGNSNFTFVLNETEYARDYEFLTFSDRRAEEAAKNKELTPQDIKEMLRQSMHHDDEGLSKFGIDIRATVTPQTLFTLVMDPAAGDKITARGHGAMQVKYESDVDEMMMYGKYEIDEGNYNFSLQDIILRDFKIREGSYITFNGNPLAADLDISATYRVNTNLSDLDKSFSTDRDLNRTNVPVDAVLSVEGNMTSPDITFDIELPTLTQDVERKVKSIISTDDMMNRQIIYLLALNRFYTPEYMGASGNGGELAAVASSTISSQLTNILGQLTDKFSVAPSFRSDKGDFSDIEVDVALSSRLLNNRLLINGNFGYRDRSTSSTTFVGDFDVEYLLSKNGNLRLKAYNHFNDQNYYLREALTTQGLGIVYRKDFDDMVKFLKKKK
ncbi:MAG: translocation/assembly module TamB [Muribaculaceae bacterium]|nr:translocation/assembly module TamB [Muribaculaceae bacterium]